MTKISRRTLFTRLLSALVAVPLVGKVSFAPSAPPPHLAGYFNTKIAFNLTLWGLDDPRNAPPLRALLGLQEQIDSIQESNAKQINDGFDRFFHEG